MYILYSDKIKSYGFNEDSNKYYLELIEIENQLKKIRNKEEMNNIEVDSINEVINKILKCS